MSSPSNPRTPTREQLRSWARAHGAAWRAIFQQPASEPAAEQVARWSWIQLSHEGQGVQATGAWAQATASGIGQNDLDELARDLEAPTGPGQGGPKSQGTASQGGAGRPPAPAGPRQGGAGRAPDPPAAPPPVADPGGQGDAAGQARPEGQAAAPVDERRADAPAPAGPGQVGAPEAPVAGEAPKVEVFATGRDGQGRAAVLVDRQGGTLVLFAPDLALGPAGEPGELVWKARPGEPFERLEERLQGFVARLEPPPTQGGPA